jgi:hypothetical protein
VLNSSRLCVLASSQTSLPGWPARPPFRGWPGCQRPATSSWRADQSFIRLYRSLTAKLNNSAERRLRARTSSGYGSQERAVGPPAHRIFMRSRTSWSRLLLPLPARGRPVTALMVSRWQGMACDHRQPLPPAAGALGQMAGCLAGVIGWFIRSSDDLMQRLRAVGPGQ